VKREHDYPLRQPAFRRGQNTPPARLTAISNLTMPSDCAPPIRLNVSVMSRWLVARAAPRTINSPHIRTGFVALTDTGLLGMLRPHAADSAYCATGSGWLGVHRVSLPVGRDRAGGAVVPAVRSVYERLTAINARPVKTMLARIIANSSGAEFLEVSGPQFISKWVGQRGRGPEEVHCGR
jgi:ATPase family associated with various cellular activities (AAA)